MLDKMHYYHGAAIVSLLEDEKRFTVKKAGILGYLVNDCIFVFLKYTTKARSPWRFTFDQEDIDRCAHMLLKYKNIVLGLVCGGDGICGLKQEDFESLLKSKPGWISTKRNHNERYEVAGSRGNLSKKIPISRWPSLFSDFVY